MTNNLSDVSGLSLHDNTPPQSPKRRFVLRSARGRTPEGEPNPIDVYIGSRMRLRRQLLGLSQEALAHKTGLTFQQIQKYERGMNRIGGSRLWDLSCILGVEPNYFYMQMPKEIRLAGPRMQRFRPQDLHVKEEEFNGLRSDPMQAEESINLVMAYRKIYNRDLAKNLYDSMINASKTTWGEKEENSANEVGETEPGTESLADMSIRLKTPPQKKHR